MNLIEMLLNRNGAATAKPFGLSIRCAIRANDALDERPFEINQGLPPLFHPTT